MKKYILTGYLLNYFLIFNIIVCSLLYLFGLYILIPVTIIITYIKSIQIKKKEIEIEDKLEEYERKLKETEEKFLKISEYLFKLNDENFKDFDYNLDKELIAKNGIFYVFIYTGIKIISYNEETINKAKQRILIHDRKEKINKLNETNR